METKILSNRKKKEKSMYIGTANTVGSSGKKS